SLLIFPFHSHVPTRDLHSFPTRRSSDLMPRPYCITRRTAECSWKRTGRDVAMEDLMPFDVLIRGGRVFDPGQSLDAVMDVGITRSEEHTSELQSLRHLVCRLLLEKKKK